MRKLVTCFLILHVSAICFGQSTESDIHQIRTKYQNIEDSLIIAKKIILERTFDSSPELWILLYHDSYNIDFRDLAKKLTLDGITTVFYWNSKIRKIEIEEFDWPDGFSYSKKQFYFQEGKIFFSYNEDRSYNYFDKNSPLVSVTEERHYFKNDELIRHLTKEFTASSNTFIQEESSKAQNKVIEDNSTKNLNDGYLLIESLRANGYLNLEGY